MTHTTTRLDSHAIYTYTGEDFVMCPKCGTRIDPPFDGPDGGPEGAWEGECDHCGFVGMFEHEDEEGRFFTTLRVTLEVSYEELGGMSPDEIRELLDFNLRNAIGNGLLTGDTAALVDTWSLQSEVES